MGVLLLVQERGGGVVPHGELVVCALAHSPHTLWPHDGGHPFIDVVALGSSRAVGWRIQADFSKLLLNSLGRAGQLGAFHLCVALSVGWAALCETKGSVGPVGWPGEARQGRKTRELCSRMLCSSRGQVSL